MSEREGWKKYEWEVIEGEREGGREKRWVYRKEREYSCLSPGETVIKTPRDKIIQCSGHQWTWRHRHETQQKMQEEDERI